MQATRGTSLTDDADRATGGRRLVGVLLAVATVVVVLDQVTKALAVSQLADGRVVRVVGELLQLRLTFNPGAAFSFATGYTFVFTIIAAIVVVVILRISPRLRSLPWAVALGGLLGGAVGNLIDRIWRDPAPFRGHVVDFIELPHWPLFNLADSAIVGAAVLMVVLSLFGIEYDGSHRPRKDATPSGEPDDERT
jgi:signal peptidase II